MFTGIIQAIGKVHSKTERQLQVAAPGLRSWEPWAIGESVAINGCCLTVVEEHKQVLTFDISEETWRRTNLGGLAAGSRVNLERAMRPSTRLGGHIVQGHVDAVGELISITAGEGGDEFRFRAPEGTGRYLIDKGSIAVDGVSLTIVQPTGDEFAVWIIPHTKSETNIGERQVGDGVNLEFDVIAKHVEKLLGAYRD
jgi:riboflavin synthase